MRFKLWAGLALVFIFGILVGSLGTGFYFQNRVEQFEKSALPDKTRLLMRRLSDELDLRGQQRREIEKILREFHSRASELRRSVRPEMDQLRDRSFSAIAGHLDEEQKRAFSDLQGRLRRWRPQDRLREELRRADINELMSQLKVRLELTDEQETKVRPILEKSLHEQRRLLEKTGEGHDAGRSLRRELREHGFSVEEQLSKFLTAEQLVKLRRWTSDKRREKHEGVIKKPDQGPDVPATSE